MIENVPEHLEDIIDLDPLCDQSDESQSAVW